MTELRERATVGLRIKNFYAKMKRDGRPKYKANFGYPITGRPKVHGYTLFYLYLQKNLLLLLSREDENRACFRQYCNYYDAAILVMFVVSSNSNECKYSLYKKEQDYFFSFSLSLVINMHLNGR